MAKCSKNNHEIYHSRADAEYDMARLIADAKRTRTRGKSYKRLNVFPCGNHWHVGRLPQHYNPKPAPKPEDQLPTFAEARRKLKQIDRTYYRHVDFMNRWRAEQVAKVIEADRKAGWLD